MGVETQTLYLSGRGKDDAAPWEFFCTAGMRSNVWTTIPVPSCWEQQGFGAYGYQADPLAEQGRYRCRFDVPAEWRDKAVRLVFEGAMTDTDAVVNGKPAGPKHQGGFTRFAYDVTRLLIFGETNLLEATVSKRSSNEGVNRAERTGDYWNFGGIFRPVYLEALPRTYVDRVAIDARADGALAVDVFLGGDLSAAQRVRVAVEGAAVSAETAVPAGAACVRLQARASAPKLWTAETPHLYRAVVTLDARGCEPHAVAQRFGFRTVEVREGRGLFVNGRRVLLKGACRHSFWPESGRTLSEALSRADVALMKEMNMNAVRMSHYPPDAHFLDVCDEQGLYVLDELSGWQKAHDTEVGERLVRELVARDVNHPCILLWDNGNEGGWNTDLDDDFAKWDPQGRRVLHPWAVSQGVDTAHYKHYDVVSASCAGGTVYMPTEFLHALYDGGGGAGLDDYWEVMRQSPVSAGGFIWALVDEGVARTDQGGRIDVHGNRAPDGLVGPHREREGSFYAVREIWCPVQARAAELPTVELENRYDFTDLSQCRFDWALTRVPSAAAPAAPDSVASGSLSGPRVAPGASGALLLPLPAGWREADLLLLTAKDPAGRELWTWTWPLQESRRQVERALGARPEPSCAPEIREAANAVTVSVPGLACAFSRADGALASLTVRGRTVSLTGGPRFVASATQTVRQEQGKGKKPKSVTAALNLSGTCALKSFSHRLAANAAVIEASYGGPLAEARWTVSTDGWLALEYAYRLDAPCDLAGVHFDYPEAKVKSVRWFGKGPYRVWKNRLKGVRWGVWQNAYNDTTPGVSWDYPEFKGYFGEWRWAAFETEEGRLTMVTDAACGYLGIYRPNEGPEPAKTKLYTPQTGLAALDAIPPIGTKFGEPGGYGPQSQPNPASGLVRRTLYVRFD
jgi:hypothetical protein